MRKEMLATIGISLAGAAAAWAQDGYTYYYAPEGAGPYAGVDAGPTFFQNGELKNYGGPATGSVHYRVGAMADANFGYAFNQYIAAGVEFGVNGTTIDNIPGYYLSNARIYNVPFLANVTFSYPIPHTILTPYIGGGAGGSDSVFDPDQMNPGSGPNYGPNSVYGSEDDVVFAWEAYAGMRFDLTPNMSLAVGYKYFATANTDFSYPPSPNLDVGFRGVETHSVEISFNVRF